VFEEQMLQFHEQEQNWFGEVELRPTDGVGEDAHRTNRNWQVHQPLFDGRGRWRDELNLEELVRFNRAAAPLMETFGYYDPTVGDLDNPFPTVPIEMCATSNLKSYPSWAAQIHGEVGEALSGEPNYDKWLDETHHRIYGRPWAIGRSYFEFFMLRGVRPTDRFLDFGCGAGRLGIPMIRYLRPGHYFGIEPHHPSLQAFADYEIPLHGVAYKAPRLLLDDTANLGHFGTRFDVIADLYVTHHLTLDLVQHIYTRFAEFLEPGGRVFVPHKPMLPADVLHALGFAIGEPERRGILALERSHKSVIKTDEWHILRRQRDTMTRTSEPG
jgi:SAM-dependent methyltransferase